MKTIRLTTPAFYEVRWLIRIKINNLRTERSKATSVSGAHQLTELIAHYEGLLDQFAEAK